MSKWSFMNIKGKGHSLTFVQGHSDSTFSNFFSLETARPIEAKFHVESPWDGLMKVSTNGLYYMIKIAVMSIYGKYLQNSSFLEPKNRWPWKLICGMGYSSTIKFVQMMTLSWPWPTLQQGQYLSLLFKCLSYRLKPVRWIYVCI